MGEKLHYQAPLETEFARVSEAIDRLTTHFHASWVAGEGAIQRAYLERSEPLPAFEASEWPALLGFTVRGRMAVDRDPLPVFRKLFEDFAAAGEADLRAMASLGFEERSSKQNKNHYDTFFAELAMDRGQLCYSSNGSHIQKDPAYACEVFRRMADSLDVPIVVVKTDTGYTLEHRDPDRKLRLTGGFAGNNPDGFWCDTEPSIDLLLGALARCRDTLSSGKTTAVNWFLGPHKQLGMSPGAEVCGKLLRLLEKLSPEAEHFSMSLEYQVSGIDQLEILEALCGKDDVIFTEALAFEQPDGGLGHLNVETSSAGYRLDLELAEPVDLTELEHRTEIRFESSD